MLVCGCGLGNTLLKPHSRELYLFSNKYEQQSVRVILVAAPQSLLPPSLHLPSNNQSGGSGEV
eukprot:1343349-Amphidinium_carterae.1